MTWSRCPALARMGGLRSHLWAPRGESHRAAEHKVNAQTLIASLCSNIRQWVTLRKQCHVEGAPKTPNTQEEL